MQSLLPPVVPSADVLAHSIVTAGANHAGALRGEQALARGASAPKRFCKREATGLLLSQDLLFSPLRRFSSEYRSRTRSSSLSPLLHSTEDRDTERGTVK